MTLREEQTLTDTQRCGRRMHNGGHRSWLSSADVITAIKLQKMELARTKEEINMKF
jgi:hypothetical protein